METSLLLAGLSCLAFCLYMYGRHRETYAELLRAWDTNYVDLLMISWFIWTVTLSAVATVVWWTIEILTYLFV